MAAGATSSATARSKRPRGGAANGGSKQQQQSSSETPQASTTTVTASSSSSSTGKRQRRRSVDTRYSAPTQEELSALRNLVPASASDSVQKGQQARLAAAAGSSTASLTMEVSPLSRFLACLLRNSLAHLALQLEEVLRLLRPRYGGSTTKALEKVLWETRALLTGLPKRAVRLHCPPPSSCVCMPWSVPHILMTAPSCNLLQNVTSKTVKVKGLPVKGWGLKPGATPTLNFEPPATVNVVGSFLLRTLAKPDLNVDMAIQIPTVRGTHIHAHTRGGECLLFVCCL